MSEENKVQLIEELLKRLNQADKEQQTVIKHMAELQTELTQVGMDPLAKKLDSAFSDVSKCVEVIKSIAHDCGIELNRLRNEKA